MFGSSCAAIAGRKRVWEGVTETKILCQDQCFEGQAYFSKVCYNARRGNLSQANDSPRQCCYQYTLWLR